MPNNRKLEPAQTMLYEWVNVGNQLLIFYFFCIFLFAFLLLFKIIPFEEMPQRWQGVVNIMPNLTCPRSDLYTTRFVTRVFPFDQLFLVWFFHLLSINHFTRYFAQACNEFTEKIFASLRGGETWCIATKNVTSVANPCQHFIRIGNGFWDLLYQCELPNRLTGWAGESTKGNGRGSILNRSRQWL